MAERTEDVTITLDNGKQIRVKPHHTPEQILKGVKALDPEGSYPSYLKRYGELQANKDGEPSKLSAYADSAVQGLTLGFADEIGAAGDAAWGSITGKGSYSDLYDQNQAINQANFEQSQEKLGKTERLLLEYGVPIVAARQLLAKLGRKGINALKTRAGRNALKKEALDAGLTKDEAELWSKINELPNVPKSTLGKYVEKAASGAVGVGSTAAAGVGVPAAVGAGQADPGTRLDSGIAGGILGASAVNKLNPLASGFAPKSVVGEILPGFAEGGEVFEAPMFDPRGRRIVSNNKPNSVSEAEGWAAESAKYAKANKDVGDITARDILEFVPVVGDIFGAEEIYRELQKDNVNWPLVGALGGATIIGLIPGIGDAAASGIRTGARAGLKGVKDGKNKLVEIFKTRFRDQGYSDADIESGVEALLNRSDKSALPGRLHGLYDEIAHDLRRYEQQGGVVQRMADQPAEIRERGAAFVESGPSDGPYDVEAKRIVLPDITGPEELFYTTHELGHARSPLGMSLSTNRMLEKEVAADADAYNQYMRHVDPTDRTVYGEFPAAESYLGDTTLTPLGDLEMRKYAGVDLQDIVDTPLKDEDYVQHIDESLRSKFGSYIDDHKLKLSGGEREAGVNQLIKSLEHKYPNFTREQWEKIYDDINSPKESFAEGGTVGGGLLSIGKPDVNTNVVDKGARNRAAIKDFFGKTFDDKQGIHPDVKGTLRKTAELFPIVGDALAAEEIARELQKDPVDWKLIGVLGGATLIGVVPGIGKPAAAAIKKGAASVARGGKQAVETLSGYGLEVDPNTLGSTLGNVRVVKRGAPKKMQTFYIRDKMGNVKEFYGTQAQFRKKYGIGESAAKKQGGRLEGGEAQWSKSGEFKDFKTGKAKLAEERREIDDVEWDREKRAVLPRSMATEDRDMLEALVDDILLVKHNDFLDDLDLDDPYWDSVENAETIGNAAWPEIKQKIQQSNYIQGLDTETYNKVIQWAKNRTRRVFDKTEYTDPDGSRADALFKESAADDAAIDRQLRSMGYDLGSGGGSGAIDASSLYTVTQPGVERRTVMRDRGERWSGKKADVTVRELKEEFGPDEGAAIFNNLRAGGLIDSEGNYTEAYLKEMAEAKANPKPKAEPSPHAATKPFGSGPRPQGPPSQIVSTQRKRIKLPSKGLLTDREHFAQGGTVTRGLLARKH